MANGQQLRPARARSATGPRLAGELLTRALDSETARLLARDHPDPHAVLGAHPLGSRVVVRTLLPGAEAVVVLPARGKAVPATRVDPAGLFEAVFAARALPFAYRLEVSDPGGVTVIVDDPYAFAPSLGELDLHLISEGRHLRLWEKLGAHAHEVNGVSGTAFAVWAPNARSVSVVGELNHWNGQAHQLRSLGSAGVWELFVPGVQPESLYKFEVRNQSGEIVTKADPLALAAEVPPATASKLPRSEHVWRDETWLARRSWPGDGPISIYEVHLASWRRNPLEGNRSLSYLELADELGSYALDLGFTHVELLPVMQHPFEGSWGYQVSGYYAPDARLGSPDDLRELVDRLHELGLGVILDWVPAHFPRDAWALARFDGTALYEHADPRRGEHPDWGTLVFNYGRPEVANFLLANAHYWLSEFHADGIRVDAVASMLYRDYSRKAGEWVPNQDGGNEDWEAIAFLRALNTTVGAELPGTMLVAEESTAWPGVSRPVADGGLGFGFKWNLGWMHDTLDYFTRDPVHRTHHHDRLTFGLLYAFTENFVLPLSHDEVVHGKGSLLAKMPGDRWQKLANLRALYGYMWAHPGKKLLFMGGELAQEQEWSHARSLDWHLLEDGGHAGVQSLVRELNGVYKSQPSLWERDFDGSGFTWLEAGDAAANVLAFARFAADGSPLVCVCNFSPVVREGFRLGLPRGGAWRVVLNTDAAQFGGAGLGPQHLEADAMGWHNQPASVTLTLPPLGVLWLVPA